MRVTGMSGPLLTRTYELPADPLAAGRAGETDSSQPAVAVMTGLLILQTELLLFSKLRLFDITLTSAMPCVSARRYAPRTVGRTMTVMYVSID